MVSYVVNLNKIESVCLRNAYCKRQNDDLTVCAANVYISLPCIMTARMDEHAIRILNLLALNFVISTIFVYTRA